MKKIKVKKGKKFLSIFLSILLVFSVLVAIFSYVTKGFTDFERVKANANDSTQDIVNEEISKELMI